VSANGDKDDPDAYCAALMEATESTCAARASEETMSTSRTSTDEQRQAAAERRRAGMQERTARPQLVERAQGPGGDDARDVKDRYLAFPAEIRAETVERDGKSFYHVEGYATVFDRSYEMWDMFGPYEEEVAAGAADDTLAAKPDVVFLVNHRGLSLARTGGPWNGNSSTLDLSADADGLRDLAWLNPERSEVKDLMLAIDDKIVTEQSFAFMIDEGWWNEDFTKFRIIRFDINRGDVSAVNYGANPYTSIAARQQEILTDLRMADASTARGALAALMSRADFDLDSAARRYDELRRPERAKEQEDAAKGRSVALIEALLQD
jgi:hypothetical protein